MKEKHIQPRYLNNVAIQKDKQIATVVGDKGTVKRFRIDYRTGIVREVI